VPIATATSVPRDDRVDFGGLLAAEVVMLLGPVRSKRWSAKLPKSWLARRVLPPDSRHIPPSLLARYRPVDPVELMRQLGTCPDGLSPAEAAGRLQSHGRNALRQQRQLSRLSMLSGDDRCDRAFLRGRYRTSRAALLSARVV